MRLPYRSRTSLRTLCPTYRPYTTTHSLAGQALANAAPPKRQHYRGGEAPLALHILRRLREHGCDAIHGVPGDFTLPFLSYLKDTEMKWVGSCNELNAAYAADGYARVTGLGAVCTTYGVGELSAINGIAGSFAERVPVVHIVGSPRSSLNPYFKTSGRGSLKGLIHHALGRGSRMDVYSRMASRVTADVVRLGDVPPAKMTKRIDMAIGRCLEQKRPVYIDIPSDFSALKVRHVDRRSFQYEGELNLDSLEEKEALRKDLVAKLLGSQRPLIMVDGLAAQFGLKQQLNKLVKLGIPTVVTTHGLGIIDSKHPNYYGVYTGQLGNAQLKEYVDNSDFVMLFGELFSDTATGGWDAIPKQEVTTTFSGYEVMHNGCSHNIFVSSLLNQLLASDSDEIRTAIATKPLARLGPKEALQIRGCNSKPSDKISQDYLWPRLSSYFRPRDTILLANGTPLIGGAMFTLPSPVRVIASGLWFSIGQMLPAAQGAALAQASLPQSERGRTILLEGDGSFQVTVQELSTIIRHRLDMTILLVNNRGYAYERLILGPNADYNAVSNWQYTLAPVMMGAETTKEYPIVSERVETVAELEELLGSKSMRNSKGLKFIEVVMGEKDVPSYFMPALAQSGKKLGGNAGDAGSIREDRDPRSSEDGRTPEQPTSNSVEPTKETQKTPAAEEGLKWRIGSWAPLSQRGQARAAHLRRQAQSLGPSQGGQFKPAASAETESQSVKSHDPTDNPDALKRMRRRMERDRRIGREIYGGDERPILK